MANKKEKNGLQYFMNINDLYKLLIIDINIY
jgi:hypothetical protein